MKKERIKAAIGFTLLVISFLLISYYVEVNKDFLEANLSFGIGGMIIYFFLICLEVVLAPVSILPLVPVASFLWGSFTAFLLTLGGWILGSVIAFLIARRLGVPLLEKVTSVKEINKFQRFIPKKNQFLGVIVIRLFIPFDIMSYAIGFFSNISLKKYIIASLIGQIPSAFVLTFFGDIPTTIKLILFGIGIATLLAIAFYHKQLNRLFDKLFGGE